MWLLEVTQANGERLRVFLLPGQTYTIGRKECDILLLADDPSISRHHATLAIEPMSPSAVVDVDCDLMVTLSDCSKHGTFINRERIGKDNSRVLDVSDAVKLGLRVVARLVVAPLVIGLSSALSEKRKHEVMAAASSLGALIVHDPVPGREFFYERSKHCLGFLYVTHDLYAVSPDVMAAVAARYTPVVSEFLQSLLETVQADRAGRPTQWPTPLSPVPAPPLDKWLAKVPRPNPPPPVFMDVGDFLRCPVHDSKLFDGYTFVMVDDMVNERYAQAVQKCGGTVVSLTPDAVAEWRCSAKDRAKTFVVAGVDDFTTFAETVAAPPVAASRNRPQAIGAMDANAANVAAYKTLRGCNELVVVTELHVQVALLLGTCEGLRSLTEGAVMPESSRPSNGCSPRGRRAPGEVLLEGAAARPRGSTSRNGEAEPADPSGEAAPVGAGSTGRAPPQADSYDGSPPAMSPSVGQARRGSGASLFRPLSSSTLARPATPTDLTRTGETRRSSIQGHGGLGRAEPLPSHSDVNECSTSTMSISGSYHHLPPDLPGKPVLPLRRLRSASQTGATSTAGTGNRLARENAMLPTSSSSGFDRPSTDETPPPSDTSLRAATDDKRGSALGASRSTPDVQAMGEPVQRPRALTAGASTPSAVGENRVRRSSEANAMTTDVVAKDSSSRAPVLPKKPVVVHAASQVPVKSSPTRRRVPAQKVPVNSISRNSPAQRSSREFANGVFTSMLEASSSSGYLPVGSTGASDAGSAYGRENTSSDVPSGPSSETAVSLALRRRKMRERHEDANSPTPTARASVPRPTSRHGSNASLRRTDSSSCRGAAVTTTRREKISPRPLRSSPTPRAHGSTDSTDVVLGHSTSSLPARGDSNSAPTPAAVPVPTTVRSTAGAGGSSPHRGHQHAPAPSGGGGDEPALAESRSSQPTHRVSGRERLTSTRRSSAAPGEHGTHPSHGVGATRAPQGSGDAVANGGQTGADRRRAGAANDGLALSQCQIDMLLGKRSADFLAECLEPFYTESERVCRSVLRQGFLDGQSKRYLEEEVNRTVEFLQYIQRTEQDIPPMYSTELTRKACCDIRNRAMTCFRRVRTTYDSVKAQVPPVLASARSYAASRPVSPRRTSTLRAQTPVGKK